MRTATEFLNGAANIQMTHVPYKGAANALLDLAAGQINVMISNYSLARAADQGGQGTADRGHFGQASPAFPDLPPLAQAVPGYAIEIWVTVFAPPGRRYRSSSG